MNCVKYSPDGEHFVSGGADGQVINVHVNWLLGLTLPCPSHGSHRWLNLFLEGLMARTMLVRSELIRTSNDIDRLWNEDIFFLMLISGLPKRLRMYTFDCLSGIRIHRTTTIILSLKSIT